MLKMVDCLKCTFSGKVQQVLLTYISQADCMYAKKIKTQDFGSLLLEQFSTGCLSRLQVK